LQIKQQQNAILGDMKTGKSQNLLRFMLLMMLTGMSLTGFLLPAPAYSDSPTGMVTGVPSSTSVNDDKAANTKQITPITQSKAGRKHILNDEAKDLSGFFILGIVINIIMGIAFTWWFSREWRRSKK